MREIHTPQRRKSLWCDISTGNLWLLSVYRQIFDSLHSISHPGIIVTASLINKIYAWSNIIKRLQVSSYIFLVPDTLFDHEHVDIPCPLPTCQGYNYFLTCIGRPEIIPLTDICSQSVSQAVFTCWISWFDISTTITTHMGTQFELSLSHP